MRDRRTDGRTDFAIANAVLHYIARPIKQAAIDAHVRAANTCVGADNSPWSISTINNTYRTGKKTDRQALFSQDAGCRRRREAPMREEASAPVT